MVFYRMEKRPALVPQSLRETIEDIEDSMTGLNDATGKTITIYDTARILDEALQDEAIRYEIMQFAENN